jgi:hypothetical protein
MDALYFRVSSDRQTAENQFEDLLQVAEQDGSGRDWSQIRATLADCVYEEQLSRQRRRRSGKCTGCGPKLPTSSPRNASTSSKEDPGSAALDPGRYSSG